MWWQEREIVVAHGRRKTKKLICGMEGEIVVAHGRLLSSYGCSWALGDVTLGQKTFIYSNGFFQKN